MAIAAYVLFALAAGAALPLQVGANSELARWVDSPVRAAFLSFAVGVVALAVLTAVAFRDWPSAGRIADAPWWAWLGGFLGVFYVIASVVTGPRLGAAAFVAVVLGGQSVAALVLDHFGWVGFEQREISVGRIVGIVLVAAGVALVRAF